SKTYPLTANDVGATIRVAVRASNLAGSSTVESPVTAVVGAAAPAVLPPPAVSGTAAEGQTLPAGRGTWSGTPPISYAYQWRRGDAGGASCSDIAGAASTTYLLTTTDIGATIRVAVSASNAGGSATATSTETAVVKAPPPANLPPIASFVVIP